MFGVCLLSLQPINGTKFSNMENYLERLGGIENRLDGTLNELSLLIEEMFNTSSFELSNLPADYSACDDALQKAMAQTNRVICALKVQAVLEDSLLIDPTEQTALQASKRETLQAILEA